MNMSDIFNSFSDQPATQAIIATITIGLTPWLVIVPLLLFSKKRQIPQWVMRPLILFSVGCLFGDAFLHMFPEMIETFYPNTHSHGHDSGDIHVESSHNHSHDHHDNHSGHHDHDDDHHHHHEDHTHHHHHEDNHAADNHHDDGHHHHSHDIVLPLLLLSGIVVFYTIERIASILHKNGGGGHGHSHGGHSHGGHSHNHNTHNHHNHTVAPTPIAKDTLNDDKMSLSSPSVTSSSSSSSTLRQRGKASIGTPSNNQQSNKHDDNNQNPSSSNTDNNSNIITPSTIPILPPSTALLTVLADCIHNFTDGIALSISFHSSSSSMRFSTYIAILMHEIPHELSDYMLLLSSGITLQTTLYIQLLTALSSLFGCIIGNIAIIHFEYYMKRSMPLICGSFIYIALSVLYSLSNDTSNSNNDINDNETVYIRDETLDGNNNDNNKMYETGNKSISSDNIVSNTVIKSTRSTILHDFSTLFYEMSSLVSGIGFMYLVVLLE